MRLLQIFPSTLRGGAEEYCLRTARFALKAGWDVEAAFPYTALTKSLVADFEAMGVRCSSVVLSDLRRRSWVDKVSDLIQGMATVLKVIRSRPDAVQLMLPAPNVGLGPILACALLRRPAAVVFQLAHEPLAFSERSLRLYRWARNRRQQWVAVSRHNRRVLSQTFAVSESEILCIPNGAPIQHSVTDASASESRARVRESLSLSDSQTLIVTVGRLTTQKGYDVLLCAAAALLREFPDARFAWTGDGPMRERLAADLAAYAIDDKVSLLGHRTDVLDILCAADLFVLPSRYEGQPFALLEAMAAGLPCISTYAAGIPEILQAGVDGLLCRPGDSCELLSVLRWALNHRQEMKEMGARAKHKVAGFSEQTMVEATTCLLRSLVSDRKLNRTRD